MAPNDAQLEDIIQEAVDAGLARVHTQVPGRVLDYDHESATAKVQLIVAHSYADPQALNEDESRIFYKVRPLANVPVKFPAILTWPLEAGDPGWVEFAERSIDEYRATGNDATEPQDPRRFDLSDAIFYPTYFRGEHDTDASDEVLSASSLKVRSGTAAITRPPAISPVVEQYLISLVNTLNSQVHTDPLTGTTGPAAPPATAPTSGQFDASNIEVE